MLKSDRNISLRLAGLLLSVDSDDLGERVFGIGVGGVDFFALLVGCGDARRGAVAIGGGTGLVSAGATGSEGEWGAGCAFGSCGTAFRETKSGEGQ